MESINLSLPPLQNKEFQVSTKPNYDKDRPESNFSDGFASMFILAILLFFIIGWIASLIDALMGEFKESSTKIGWIIALLLFSPIFIVYLFVAPSLKKKKKGKKRA